VEVFCRGDWVSGQGVALPVPAMYAVLTMDDIRSGSVLEDNPEQPLFEIVQLRVQLDRPDGISQIYQFHVSPSLQASW